MSENDSDALGSRSLAYEPFYAMAILLKCSETVQLDQQSLYDDGSDRATRAIDELYAEARSYVRHRKLMARSLGRDKTSEPDAAFQRLYQPIHLRTFGYVDEIVFLLTDTPDFYFRVFGEFTNSVSQICLAVVPTMASLGIRPRPVLRAHGEVNPDPFEDASWHCGGFFGQLGTPAFRRELNPFVNLGDLFEPAINGNLHVDHPIDTTPSDHPLRQSTPLVLFSRLRLGAACNLGGLTMRLAVYRLIARVVVATQVRLCDALASNGEASATLTQLEIDQDSVKNLTVSFMDNLGPEEIGILVGSRNYSVAMAVHAAIQSMTFQDLIDAEPHMREDIEHSQIHQSLLQLLQVDAHAPHAADAVLRSNHLVSLCHSSLGMSTESFAALEMEESNRPSSRPPGLQGLYNISARELGQNMKGWAEVYVRATVNAGHNSAVERRIRQILENRGPLQTKPFAWSDNVLRMLLGRYDIDFDAAWQRGANVSVLPITEVFHTSLAVEQGLTRNAPTQSDLSGHRVAETGLSEISTGLVIPVPQFATDKRFPMRDIAADHAPMIQALRNMIQLVFDGADSRLSTDRQNRAFRHLRMPVRLRRIIRAIGNVYRTGLADPILFDHLLDLYECLVALDAAITEDLPEMMNQSLEYLFQTHNAAGRTGDKIESRDVHRIEEALDGSLDHHIINGLGEYAQALVDSLDRRIYTATQHEFSEFDVDLRGGLVQLVHAATVALKCGAGLLRFCQETSFGEYETRYESELPERYIGIVTRLTVHEKSEVLRLYRNPGSRADLAVMEFDVGHLISPLEFEAYLHESAHMLLAAWDDEDAYIRPLGPPRPGSCDLGDVRTVCHFPILEIIRKAQRECVDEIFELRDEVFAVSFVQLLVYGEDYRLGQRARVAAYNSHLRAGSLNSFLGFERFARLMMTSFLATVVHQQKHKRDTLNPPADQGAIRHPWFDKDGQPLDAYWDTTSATFKHEVLNDFERYCRDIGPLYHRYRGFMTWLGHVIAHIRTDAIHLPEASKSPYHEAAVRLLRQYTLQVESLNDVLWRTLRIYHSYRKHFWADLTAGSEGSLLDLENRISDALNRGEASVLAIMQDFDKCLLKKYGKDGKLPARYCYRGIEPAVAESEAADGPQGHLEPIRELNRGSASIRSAC